MKNIKMRTILLALPLVLTACGGGNDGSQSVPATSSNNDASSETSQVSSDSSQNSQASSDSQASSSQGGSAKKVTIKFWHTFGQTIEDALKAKRATFHDLVLANDGVDITIDLKYQGAYDDIAKKISDGYGVENTPTMAVAYPDNVADYIDIGKSANSEFVVNLEKFINDDKVGFGQEKWLGDEYDEEDFVEEFYNEGKQYTVAGTYSLPFLKSTEIMFYNMDALIDVMKGYKPEFNNSKSKIEEYSAMLEKQNPEIIRNNEKIEEFFSRPDIQSYLKSFSLNYSSSYQEPVSTSSGNERCYGL